MGAYILCPVFLTGMAGNKIESYIQILKPVKMRKYIAIISYLLASLMVKSQGKEAYFLSQPCLTPDGQTVIFSYEGDLWRAAVSEGKATRLTAMQGYEENARVSPDGKWIAFTGRQFGNADVFVMPAQGGEIRQLTFNSASDFVSSWSWDSKYIYFTSDRRELGSYRISLEGGTEQRVFNDYFFLYDHNLFEHPQTGELFFNDTWESFGSQAQRKRYKGPFNPDIQSYNPGTKKYKRYTDWAGKDFGATLDRNGNIYFLSDESNGEYNLYTLEKNAKKALTNFPVSIKNAIVNADGGKVVFEKNYQLWIYDVASGKSSRINISMVRNDILPKERDFNVNGHITAFDISPDGKKMAFVSRGELFVSDVEGKFIEQMERGSAERVSEVKWLDDNRTLLFNQTCKGFQNWYVLKADGSSPLRQITADAQDNRLLALNRKRTLGVYLSGRNEVRLMDLKTLQSRTLVKDEIWGFENSGPGFSPNDEFVVFTAYRNFEQDIFVHNLKEKTTLNLTNTGITETDPLWSPDGKYIYFISSRLHPAYPGGLRQPHMYRLPLQKMDGPFRADKYRELFQDDKKDSAKKKDSMTAPIQIDAEKIMERIEQVGPEFGSQFLVTVIQNKDKTNILFLSDQADGRSALYRTILEPFEKPKTEKINGAESSSLDFAAGGDKYFVLFNGSVFKLNLEAGKVDPVAISYTFRRNLAEEFNQIFYEVWAQLDENYYDEKFHGIDWNHAREYYSQFLPFLNTRGDLRTLLNDMLGELNSSHQGFYSNGDEESVTLKNTTMETGIVFEEKDPYRVKYIIEHTPADNKDAGIQPGDELVAVDGHAIDPATNRYFYFSRPSLDPELQLVFRRDDKKREVQLHPQRSVFNQQYDEWIAGNQKRVDEKSNNRIAYSCMKNMGQGELEHFIIDMTRQLPGKEALIVDLRYNTGGNVHDDVLNFLSQRSYLQWKYREGKFTRQPNFAPSDKPIVLLINEQSLSDAEMTATGFKALKLGTLVGNETYHWIIFTSGAGLVDGSFVRLPAWGCYTLEGKDVEFNGVQPDIRVINTFEDKINGRDPQLDRAIAEILKQLK